MKRLVSLLVSVGLIFGLFITPAAAAQTDAEAMREVLLTVKSRVTIPESYSEFHYQSEMVNGKLCWQFFWQSGDYASISIEADEKGRISRYNHNRASESENSAPKVTKAQAVAASETLLAKMLPEVAEKLVLKELSVNRYNNTYRLKYIRYEHEIPISDQSVSLQIDYRTGDCKYVYSFIDYDTVVEAPGNPIGADRVQQLWIEMAQLQLVYTINSANTAELWYVPSGEIRPIAAETGEIIEKDVVWEEGVTENSTDSAGGGAASSNEELKTMLSPEEEEKNAELAGLISKEAADAAVRKHTALALSSSDTLYSAYLHHNSYGYGEPTSYWSLEYSGPITKGENPEHAYARVDAKTGELLWFNAYRDTTKSKRRVKTASAKANASALLRSALGEKTQFFGTAELQGGERDEIPAVYEYKFSRMHENIPVSNNSVRMEVNSISGKVTFFSRSWTEDVTFESPYKVIGLEAAEQALAGYEAPTLEYYTQTVYLYDHDSDSESVDWYYSGIPTTEKITLCYLGASEINQIDAYTGNVHTYGTSESNGTKYDTYSDIKGHFAEQNIQLLLDIGVLPPGEKFEPNKQVTQLDLLYFMIAAQPQYRTYASWENGHGYTLDTLYSIAIERGMITESEREPSRLMTRSDAARIAVRCTEFAPIAKDSGIFRVNYRDAASIPQKDLGYVAVATSLGIMNGNNGMFYGDRIITRGELICMICKCLAVLD